MKGQEGLTLVELLITSAIIGLIVSFLGSAVYQILTVTGYGNDKLAAMHELQNSAYWVSIDGQMASTADASNGLALTLPDESSITYSLVGTELRRTAGESQMTLAQNITDASFSVENRIITMILTSSPEGRQNVSEDGTYMVYLRPAEDDG